MVGGGGVRVATRKKTWIRHCERPVYSGRGASLFNVVSYGTLALRAVHDNLLTLSRIFTSDAFTALRRFVYNNSKTCAFAVTMHRRHHCLGLDASEFTKSVLVFILLYWPYNIRE